MRQGFVPNNTCGILERMDCVKISGMGARGNMHPEEPGSDGPGININLLMFK